MQDSLPTHSRIDVELKNIHDELNEPADSHELFKKDDSVTEEDSTGDSQLNLVKEPPKIFKTFNNRNFLRFHDPLFKSGNTKTQTVFIYLYILIKYD
jgi:hypothetical protein